MKSTYTSLFVREMSPCGSSATSRPAPALGGSLRSPSPFTGKLKTAGEPNGVFNCDNGNE